MWKNKRSKSKLKSSNNRNILASLGLAEEYNRKRKKRLFSNECALLEECKTSFFDRKKLALMGYRAVQSQMKQHILRLQDFWQRKLELMGVGLDKVFERIFRIVIVKFLCGSVPEGLDLKYRPLLKQCLLPLMADKGMFIFRQIVNDFYETSNRRRRKGDTLKNKKTRKAKSQKTSQNGQFKKNKKISQDKSILNLDSGQESYPKENISEIANSKVSMSITIEDEPTKTTSQFRTQIFFQYPESGWECQKPNWCSEN